MSEVGNDVFVEQCEADKAEFYTLYGCNEDNVLEAIVNCKNLKRAQHFYFKITGEHYENAKES